MRNCNLLCFLRKQTVLLKIRKISYYKDNKEGILEICPYTKYSPFGLEDCTGRQTPVQKLLSLQLLLGDLTTDISRAY